MVNKGGRPKLENPRTEPFGFRASKPEAEKIRELAAARGITPGEFCRLAALGKRMPPPPPPQIDTDAYIRLGKLGNLLKKALFQREDIGPEITALRDEIQQIQRRLMGINDDSIDK